MVLQTPVGAPRGLKVSARNVAAAGGWGTGTGRVGGRFLLTNVLWRKGWFLACLPGVRQGGGTLVGGGAGGRLLPHVWVALLRTRRCPQPERQD